MAEDQYTAAKPPGESGHPRNRYQTRLEIEFPRVLMAIQSMWGYPELNTYFYKLTIDERGKRDGFPKEVWDDIHLLWELHQTIVPNMVPQFSMN